MNLNESHKIYLYLQKQVEKAEELKQPIQKYVVQQIKLLEQVHDEFVSSTLAKNKDLESNIEFIGVRIKQLQAIASLCRKIGLPTEKYDNQIREIRIKNLGADFVNQYYK